MCVCVCGLEMRIDPLGMEAVCRLPHFEITNGLNHAW